MWLDIMKERLKDLGYTYKFVAQESKVAERTVSRIFAGKTPSPYADTLDRIGKVLGLTLADILADTKTVVGGKNYIELNEEHETLSAEVERLNSELALINAENSVLKDKVVILTNENDILRLKLEHKEEIISVHNYYIQLAKNKE